MTLAEGVHDLGTLNEALFMRGARNFYRAEFADARVYDEGAIAPLRRPGAHEAVDGRHGS